MEEQTDRKDDKKEMMTLKLNDFAQDIVNQLKSMVPVRTGRLRNGIQYRVEEKNGDYYVYILIEDYFKYLKPKRTSGRLPSPKEMSMASPPLPKMNDLGVTRMNELSPRSRKIMDSIDIDTDKIDLTSFEEELRKVIFMNINK